MNGNDRTREQIQEGHGGARQGVAKPSIPNGGANRASAIFGRVSQSPGSKAEAVTGQTRGTITTEIKRNAIN